MEWHIVMFMSNTLPGVVLSLFLCFVVLWIAGWVVERACVCLSNLFNWMRQ